MLRKFEQKLIIQFSIGKCTYIRNVLISMMFLQEKAEEINLNLYNMNNFF